MSEVETQAAPASLNALLLPLTDRSLLLPQSALAEVIAYTGRHGLERKSDWVLGHVEWHGLRFPLLSFEAFVGAGQASLGDDCRVAMINGIGGRAPIPYLALLIQGIPRTLVVDGALPAAQAVLSPFERAAVKIGEGTVVIPDLDALEQRLVTTGLLATDITT